MKALLKLFWQVACRRLGPQDIPHSTLLPLILAIVLMLLSAGLIVLVEPQWLAEKLMGSAAALLVWAALLYGVLSFKGVSARFNQTLSACLGTDLIISLVALPLQGLIVMVQPEAPLAGVVRGGLLAVMIWDILVKTHIYHAALGIGRPLATLLAVVIWIVVFMVGLSFLPVEAMTPNETPGV